MKQYLRSIVILLVLAGAGILAWKGMEPTLKQQIKAVVKKWSGKSPRDIKGGVPAATGVQSMEGGLTTGDEPPFAFASGPWSMVKYVKGRRTIRPNLHFDFEVPSSLDTSPLSREWHHKGLHSYHMEAGTEYSPAVRRHIGDVAIGLAAVEVGFQMWSPSPKTLVTAVVSIDRDGKQLAWFGKDLPADTGTTQGSRLNANFLLRDLQVEQNDIVSIYLWKRGGEEAFIDDMDIYFHSTDVLGRVGGKPIALDSLSSGGSRSMSYAGLTVTQVLVDSVRFQVGTPAPTTTLAAIPFGGSQNQWRFVPEEGLAYLLDGSGEPIALLRPWSPDTRTDITHYDRVVAETIPQGLLLTGCDVELSNGRERVAANPAPMAFRLELPRK